MTLRRLAGQQVMLIGVLATVMVGHRQLTGRTLKGLQDAPRLADLLLYLAVTTGLVWASAQLVRRGSPDARLGLRLDGRRLRHLAVGFLIGATLNALPWLIPLAQGAVVIEARPDVALAAVTTGLGIALLNALFEEITSRAAPLALLAEWPAWRAAALTALCFALMHGIGEALTLPRLAYLWALGVVLAACWLRTGFVWLGTGVHAGWFWASLVPSGRTQSGALFGLRGSIGAALTIADSALVLVALATLWWLRRRSTIGTPTPPAPSRTSAAGHPRVTAAIGVLLAIGPFVGCTRPPQPAAATAASLAPWRMLEGRWRGTLNDTAPFFEGYHFLDDSTVEVRSLRDAADTTAAPSGTLRVRDGVLRTGDAETEWVAEELTPDRIRFVPVRGATNAFAWERDDQDHWRATLTWNADGRQQSRQYRLTRVPPPTGTP